MSSSTKNKQITSLLSQKTHNYNDAIIVAKYSKVPLTDSDLPYDPVGLHSRFGLLICRQL